MEVEVVVCVDERSILLDIQPNLESLKREFDEWCQFDEAFRERRSSFSPIFSMFNETMKRNMEVKRKYTFKNGDTIHVTWQKKLDQDSMTESVSGSPPHSIGEDTSKPVVASFASEISDDESSFMTRDSDNVYSDEEEEEEDDEDYGEVVEYYTEDQWKALPKYMRAREKSRFELHESKRKLFENTDKILKPFEPEPTLLNQEKKRRSQSSSGSRPPKARKLDLSVPTSKQSTRVQSRNEMNLQRAGPSGSCKTPLFGQLTKSTKETPNTAGSKESGRSGSSKTPLLGTFETGKRKDTTPTAGPSNEGGGFFPKEEVKKMKPHLPYYNIREILDSKYENADDTFKEHVDNLYQKEILYDKARCYIIRVLCRHLYFSIASGPTQVTVDMREGMAKSLVMDFPKFQIAADGKNTFPWVHVFERGNGRGWMANAIRPIQKKHRVRKSKPKKAAGSAGSSQDLHVDDPLATCNDEMVENLSLLMPNKGDRAEIFKGMADTFPIRQQMRSSQTPMAVIIKKFPHLVNFDGEILQREFKMLHPSATDFCRTFQKNVPGILALNSTQDIEVPIEEESLRALIVLSKNLPKDIRSKGDKKPKHPLPRLTDVVEVVQLGKDLDSIVTEKMTVAMGPIQPYLILVQSPLTKKVAKFFLVLDDKLMQITTSSFIKALDFLLKAYFVFSVRYPLGWRSTFHCLAACFANLFEVQGNKARPDVKTPSEHELMSKISFVS